MDLFEDTDFFTSGSKGKTVFDLPDADIILYESFFTKEESDYYYNHLLQQTKWEALDMSIYGKVHTVPRMISWYEDAENLGASTTRAPWTPELLAIKSRIEAEGQIKFNSVLLNLYRNGSDAVGWHSDREKNFGKNAIIGSVTFGQTRPFRLRHKFRKDLPQVEILLNHGSFLLMAGTMQSFWEHQVPKTAKDIKPRINLTFRQVKRAG